MTTPVPWDLLTSHTDLEIAANQEQTRALIDSEPVTIVITRSTWQTTAAGGRVRGSRATLAPQVVALHRQGSNEAQRSPEGTITQTVYMAIGEFDLDIERGDTFRTVPDDGRTYNVFDVPDRLSYVVRAEVHVAR